ncbi:uncharacterized protein LOC110007375 [Amborella trichopoda]|uniref:uncharacterized protein LOC110007375 n=1 Tax=Amborella trichopoda TaxID=13333 RepID=UPI0009BD5557|nr:uncharacterized protein LOC110007375 [Amborella trichopoda]XP_020523710.1 uncharacterized protein LOC110007375 [Amborella trichopoda]XP_020523711.1 uncharacterized protein LOC110007375 [Amborella trichopoda]XP_020523712.1 uncharacterized protein LOC110007375 [Amborella trichopoda]|eukprot:XP_020523709.1 uncharacterized protein LOC110007375 [Amborella trichopoda]
MAKFRGFLKFLMFFLLIASLILVTIVGCEKEEKLENQRPNAAERAIGITSHSSHWNKVRSWINLAWHKLPLSPPSPEPPIEPPPLTAEDVVKEAVAKSYETSKMTAENAVKLAGEAMQKTAEKMKRSVSNVDGGDESDL